MTTPERTRAGCHRTDYSGAPRALHHGMAEWRVCRAARWKAWPCTGTSAAATVLGPRPEVGRAHPQVPIARTVTMPSWQNRAGHHTSRASARAGTTASTSMALSPCGSGIRRWHRLPEHCYAGPGSSAGAKALAGAVAVEGSRGSGGGCGVGGLPAQRLQLRVSDACSSNDCEIAPGGALESSSRM